VAHLLWPTLGLLLAVAGACGSEPVATPPAAPEDDASLPVAPLDPGAPADSGTSPGIADAGATPVDAGRDVELADTGNDGGYRPPVVFSVMGDIPYTAAEEPVLQAQIAKHNALSPSKFMVHLGDIKSGSDPCVEPVYSNVASLLHALTVPTFMVLGDNEWNDCTNPDEAWGFWVAHFGHFEKYWAKAPVVARQAVRDENFAWVDAGVIFIGINLPGGAVHDATEWATRLPQNAQWISDQIALHGASAYAMVLFAHADPAAKHDAFMIPYRAAVGAWGKPVLHVMGDFHQWKLDRPWPEKNILRVEVEEGVAEQPIQVTVSPTDPDTFAIVRNPL
jgi:hypothetical protein